jgi:hypothetical protein
VPFAGLEMQRGRGLHERFECGRNRGHEGRAIASAV